MMRNKRDVLCEHCQDEKYVFAYWFERLLQKKGIHMTDIPREIFKQIPVDLMVHCHCSVALLLGPREDQRPLRCHECEGVTWRFSETVEQEGYRWKKVINLSPNELKSLSCAYFERCPCSYDEQAPKFPKKTKAVKKAFGLLNIKLPRFGFSFTSSCESMLHHV